MKAAGRQKLDQRAFLEQVHECRDNGYLLSFKKIGSGAFSKVYLAYATQERMQHNSKLASDLRGKHHSMVRQARLLLTGWGLHGPPSSLAPVTPVLTPPRHLPGALASS